MRKASAAIAAVTLSALGLALPATAAQAANSAHALIQGSGSTWAANAVNQWIADVQPNGLQVVYTGNGSAQGRTDFANKTVDFAVSDIGYQGTDEATGASDTSRGRAYAYLPIVAGGTSFPYQVRVGGQLVRNLRLSGETIAKIFTNQITNWDDPAITQDNNGRKLPSLPITPVVHSEGSGDTAQFTTYLAKQFPSLWTKFQGRSGFTEYFPRKGNQVAENGSDGVMNFISSGSANGAIGYDEYSYALGQNYPVAKLENAAGYFTLPNQYNVAVALTKAQINYDAKSPDYLLQKLDQVYVDNDPRTYPLSSYSYMIIPTAANDAKMTTAKRQTLADYLYYSICQGQKEMGPIGYSPLPVNLVQAGFKQIAKEHQADSAVDLTKENVTTCHNPTFIAGHPTENYLAKIAPKPPACDKAGAGPCTGSGDTGQINPGGNAGIHVSTPIRSSGTTSGSGSTGTASPGAAGGGGGSAPGAAASGTAGGASGAAVDPATGSVAGGSTGSDGQQLVGSPTQLPGSQSSALRAVLAVLAGLLLVALVVVPPLLWQRIRSRDASG